MKYLIFLILILLPLQQVAAFEKEANSTAQLASLAPATDYRVVQLTKYLRSHNSPAVDAADEFVKIADEFNLDWKFIAAIAGVESTFCKHIPFESFNCWGWGIPTGANSGIRFTSYIDGIYTVSKGIRTKYINNGLLTIEEIGSVYAASPTWATRVRFFMKEIESNTKTENKREIALSL